MGHLGPDGPLQTHVGLIWGTWAPHSPSKNQMGPRYFASWDTYSKWPYVLKLNKYPTSDTTTSALDACARFINDKSIPTSHDCRALVTICRREIASYHNDNKIKFTVEEHGFKERCQETSVPDALKFLVGMITRGPAVEETVTETQVALSIAQLVFFNTTTKATNANRTETPMPVYIGPTGVSLKVQEWRSGG